MSYFLRYSHLSMHFVLFFSFITNVVSGQIIRTEPAAPNQFSTITLYFDASQGNGALNDFEGAVYGHMGLITTKSTHPSDWKYVIGDWGTEDDRTLMTSEGNNIYSKTYTINEFHNLPRW